MFSLFNNLQAGVKKQPGDACESCKHFRPRWGECHSFSVEPTGPKNWCPSYERWNEYKKA